MSTCEKNEKGVGVLRNPWLNRGLAFSEQERDALGLRGLLPAAVSTRDQQVQRWKDLIAQQPTPLMKYVTLDTARMIDEALYFQLVMENVEEYMPLIYTPTVGEACQKFGRIYRAHRGLYICAEDRGHVRDIVANVPNQKVDIIVENRIAERCLRNGQRKDARSHALKAWKIQHTKVSVMLVIASLFPYAAVVKMRSMIKSRSLYWRIKKMWS